MLSCRAGRATASVTASPMIRKNFIVFFLGDTGTHAYPSRSPSGMTVWERAYIEAESKKLLSCRTESELTGVTASPKRSSL
jgi:hypothetical protein